jgi:NAD+ synthase
MRIAVIQFNPVVGDIVGNADQIIAQYENAAKSGFDLVVFPECAVTGYPIEDLVSRHSFMDAVERANQRIIDAVMGGGFMDAGIIFGTPTKGNVKPRNSAYLIDPVLKKVDLIHKTELPNYGVFDEKRVFEANTAEPFPIEFRGQRIGLMICEDCWFPSVSRSLSDNDATFLLSINGSPFEAGKNVTRHQVIANRIKETGLPFLYVNMIGGQDELVFDGGSFYYDAKGYQSAPYFKEGLFAFEFHPQTRSRHFEYNDAGVPTTIVGSVRDDGSFSHWIKPPENRAPLHLYPKIVTPHEQEIYQAVVLGTRDYLLKQGFKSVVLGYSGGVDSGLVAAVACDAIGPENVHLVRLPSAFSSDHSLSDAEAGADRLGAQMRTIPIENVVNSLRVAYSSAQYEKGMTAGLRELEGVADENIQARARGTILMAISNQEGHILLTTGNKSEVSVGYSTLYGDMSGGFNPIKDCYKTTVWDLCRWRNAIPQKYLTEFGFLGRATQVVPEEIIVKPPSAELRPDQKDEDSLPPYPVLDSILKAMIEEELSVADIVVELEVRLDVVQKIRKLVDNAEYKRRQAAPGVKIGSKIFGRDRRYPIVNRWRN